MRFYEAGWRERGFEAGIAAAIEAILASPQFLFRLEPAPSQRRGASLKPGQPYRLGDLELFR